jgi:hypothetical protein
MMQFFQPPFSFCHVGPHIPEYQNNFDSIKYVLLLCLFKSLVPGTN